MNYRTLGRTGLSVSEVGYGAEHLEGKEPAVVDAVVGRAVEAGVNIMDVFMPGAQIRSQLGHALRGHPEVLLQGHVGAVVQADGQYARSRDTGECETAVLDFLQRLGRETIDFGMMHFIDTQKDFDGAFETPYIDYCAKLKERGLIRFLGASSHNPVIARKMAQTGLIDVLMFSINPAFDLMPAQTSVGQLLDYDHNYADAKLAVDPARTALYAECAERGVGITVMKSLASGTLLDATRSPFGVALTPAQCIQYSLDRPAVASVLVGANTVEQMDSCLAYVDAAPEQRDYAALAQGTHFAMQGQCMYCNHCLPCPANLDIAALHRLRDLAAQGLSPTLQAHIAAQRPGDCINCGACEKRCPFGVPVMEHLQSLTQPT